MTSNDNNTRSEIMKPVLLVDGGDEELKNLVLPYLLEFSELYTTDNGGEALALFLDKLPCIVVLSSELADMTGFDLCARLLAREPEAQIILIGREWGDAVFQRAMEAGAVRYIVMDEYAGESLMETLAARSALCRKRRRQQQEMESLRLQSAALELAQNDLAAARKRVAELSLQRNAAFELARMLVPAGDETGELKELALLLSEGGKPEAEPFSLRSLISSLRTAGREGSEEELDCTLPAYLPDPVLGNRSVIRHVLSALLENAQKNSSGGVVTLKVDLKEKNSSGMNIRCAVDFRDGSTEANSYLSIQEYLAAVDVEDAAAVSGIPGLSLAAALTERMGGAMWVKSIMNRGLTYYAFFPLAECAADGGMQDSAIAVPSPEPERAPFDRFSGNCAENLTSASKRRVLLADDNDVDRLKISRLLEGLGMDVIQVADGREAVDEFDDCGCDMVLMDILMPEMDGFEATRMIRERERLAGTHTPVIALTSYSLKAIHEKCISVGMDGHLQKPVSLHELAKLFNPAPSNRLATGNIPPENEAPLPLLDIETAMISLNNNNELFQEVVALFLSMAPFSLRKLTDAITDGPMTDVVRLAHMIKGMASNIFARRFVTLLEQIEDAASQGTLADPGQFLTLLSAEFGALQDALTSLERQKEL